MDSKILKALGVIFGLILLMIFIGLAIFGGINIYEGNSSSPVVTSQAISSTLF